MSVQFANNAHSTLASGISDSATSITVASGHGARFPTLTGSQFFFATLIDTSNNLEIVKCTARSTDVLTVTRAQESTTARAFSSGDRIELRVTAAGLAAVQLTDGDKGDITVASSGASWTIDDNAVDSDTIAANAVTGAKLNNDTISAQTELAAEPADTDEFLVSDAGVLKRVDYSLIKGGGGKVLQVVTCFSSAKETTTSSTDVAISGLSASLTPSATSSKILIMADLGSASTSLENRQQVFSFYRDIGGGGYSAVGIGTDSGDSNNQQFGFGFSFGTITSPQDNYHPVSGHFLDSPNTTSAVTYKVYHRVYQHPDLSGSPVGSVNGRASSSGFSASSSITIMEIGA